MRYRNVCLESIVCTLPEEIVSSEQIEARLKPLYDRLGLPEGRLELMTGIRQRRFWPVGTRPSQKSVESGKKAIFSAKIDRSQIGALVHGSVCRDYLEPATACTVHQQLGLSAECLIYDVSNACLGLLNATLQVANMIELGQIRAGLVVGTEDSRSLVENTITQLNQDSTLTRNSVKPAMASLTIGSASAAMLLVHREISQTGRRLLAGTARTFTQHCGLCEGGGNELGNSLAPLMATDAEMLMQAGIEAAQATFTPFLAEAGWKKEEIHKTVCHQVGRTHRKLVLGALGLDPANDFHTLENLGNTGSAALPTTAALALESGFIAPNDRLALLGIGSGINVIMLALE